MAGSQGRRGFRASRRSEPPDACTNRETTDGPRISASSERATSASWPTSMRARRRRPSASSTTPASTTRSARSTRAPRPWTAWCRSRSAASPSPRAATNCFWTPPSGPHEGSQHRINIIDTPGPRRLHDRGRALAARARRRGRGVRRRQRRRAADRDGLAPGRQVPRAAHRVRQQDGQDRRRLRR